MSRYDRWVVKFPTNRMKIEPKTSGLATGKDFELSACTAAGCSFPPAKRDRLQIGWLRSGKAQASRIMESKGQVNRQLPVIEPLVVGT